MSYTFWKIKSQDASLVKKLASKLKCSEIISKLLINRNITDENDAKLFLNPTPASVHDPFILNDMDLATNRIIKAVENNEKICIYGDYDVDGITSVSVLYLYLANFFKNLEYYIPDRFSQGYGINKGALDTIKSHGSSLIITVDTGISAIDEIEYASSIGLDVIVTDHHECQEKLPGAMAVVNPKRHDNTYPFTKLAGVGVVYKLICALDKKFGTTFSDNYLDLVAIGTIADIMPLLDENRYIVKIGLEKIVSNPNLGLHSLMEITGVTSNITASSIGFAIAPRINATGRMASAETAVELFISDNPDNAKVIAQKLCDLNLERQKIENQIYVEATEIIEKHQLNKKYNALVLWKEGWHNGVIGIVASRLKEKYNKPVVLFSVDKVSKGSGRSAAPINLYSAFEQCSDITIQYGGHKYAAGLLVENENLYKFRDRLSELVGNIVSEQEELNSLDVECILGAKQLTYKVADDISSLQPYGKSNDTPLFCVKNLRISDIYPTSNNKHLRLKLTCADKQITAFYFGVSPVQFDYVENDFVDVICEINTNEYRNIKTAQLVIRDIRLSENQLFANKIKREYCDNESNILKCMLPLRSDIATTYKFLKSNFEKGKNTYNLDTVSNLVNKICICSLSYEKVYFSIKILFEIGVLQGYYDDINLTINNIATEKGFDLTDSQLLLSIYEKAGVKFGS